jgi:hypothetical protein
MSTLQNLLHERLNSFLPTQINVTGGVNADRFQNVYDADFEYGTQPLRWEVLTATGGAVVHLPGQGGVSMSVTGTAGSLAIRQSRAYHRYQPGKSMYFATAQNFGPAVTGQVQRVGMFDDGNGVFFEQGDSTAGNPTGMSAVLRSDATGVVVDTRFPLPSWNGDTLVARSINWSLIQMVWIEFAWYGAGAIRWGVQVGGYKRILHTYSHGNTAGQTAPWARTGNLPARYELRNISASTAQTMFHYGASVGVLGGVDEQRGFTYAYGMAAAAPRRAVAAATTRFPVLSFRMRPMGTIEYTQASSAITAGTTTTLTATGTPWTVNQWAGRGLNFVNAGVNYTARIISNTTSVLTFVDVVTGGAVAAPPVAGQNYTIGLLNRGQLLPRRLLISSSALAQCEIFYSTPTSPVVLTGANFAALTTLGSAFSFAERDVAATAYVSGGEKVYSFTLPAGGSGLQDIDLQDLFPLFNTIRGDRPDILSVLITTQTGVAADVGMDIICQEAMS